MQNPKTVLTAIEAAEHLRVSRVTVYRLCKSDPSFPFFKVGQQIFVNLEDLEEWKKRGGSERSNVVEFKTNFATK